MIPANIWQLIGISVILFYVFRDPQGSGEILLDAGDAASRGVTALQGGYATQTARPPTARRQRGPI